MKDIRVDINVPGLDIFESCQREIQKENRHALRLMARIGIPLGLGHLLIQAFIAGKGININSTWLLVYFILMALWEKFLLPEEPGHFILTIYLAEAPLMFMGVMSGTVLDPDRPAVTIMLFLMFMPVFIFDRADRVWTVLTGWLVFFVVMATLTKPSEVATVDYYHILDYYISSLAVTFVVLNVRYTSLKNMVNAQFLLTHDEITGAKNRQALTMDMEDYTGKPLFILYVDLDQLTMINDLYGHETGDLALRQCAKALKDVFAEENVYRAGGDEFFCFAPGEGIEFASCLDRIRQNMSVVTRKGDTITTSCSFGYVAGEAHDRSTLSNMLHLAEVYAHKATSMGSDQSEGGLYSEENLRAQIVDNETSIHVREYERNQLTGLPAMSYFIDRAEEILREVAQPGKRPVIGYFNLSDFKGFNDKFGYAAGDELIRYTAGLLKRFFSEGLICHVTGDQFGIICYRSEVENAMTAINGRLMTYKSNHPVTAKAGFVRYHEGDSIIADFDKAQMACRSIRGMKGKTMRYYDQQFDEEQRFRAYILTSLDEAIRRGDLKVYYQSIINAQDGRICAQEALVRWSDSQYGIMSPARFVPVLEENRLMHKVDLFMVRQVLEDFKTKEEAGYPLVPVSVNFSRHDFEQCDLVHEVSQLVDRSGYHRYLIKIEITENAFVADQFFLKGEIERFKREGFAVWMDDFGSGYSSLNLLQELPFNLIKIDMEFMRRFESSDRNRIIVEDILRMVRRIRVRTLTEGVETAGQFEELKKLGCEFMQGYYFGRPHPLEAVLGSIPASDFAPIEGKDGYFEEMTDPVL